MKWFISVLLLFVLILAAIAMPEKSPHKIMAVVAHYDDGLFLGPLLAHYARQGARTYLVIMTQATTGRPGVPYSIPNGPELARVHAEEAQCACRELGIDPPVILDFEAGQLGKAARPPWEYLARAESEIRHLFSDNRPEVVITFGPEGASGHPDHRLTSDVVSQVVQSGAEGMPRQLFYFGIPTDRLPSWHGQEPLSGVDASYLTVRVPYSKDDLAAVQKAFKCYKTSFPPEEMEAIPKQADEVLWRGRIYLRPWFGAEGGEDLFSLRSR